MAIWKRFEIWLLLVLIAAGLVWVFTSTSEEGPGGMAGSSPAEEAPVTVRRASLERDYGNARLDLEVRVRNATDEPLVMQGPAVKLLSASGREVPSFFLAFDPPPEVPARSTRDVQLRYWLEASDLSGPLTLTVQGNSAPVKNATALDLASLPNGQKQVFETSNWKLP